MQQANAHCDVGGDGRPQRQNVVSSQSPTQQGADVPSVVDNVVHDHVTPIMNDKVVPTETSVPDKSVAKSQRDARALARADGQPSAVDRQRSTASGPPLGQPSTVNRQRSTARSTASTTSCTRTCPSPSEEEAGGKAHG
jgi:hypothetical protein